MEPCRGLLLPEFLSIKSLFSGLLPPLQSSSKERGGPSSTWQQRAAEWPKPPILPDVWAGQRLSRNSLYRSGEGCLVKNISQKILQQKKQSLFLRLEKKE